MIEYIPLTDEEKQMEVQDYIRHIVLAAEKNIPIQENDLVLLHIPVKFWDAAAVLFGREDIISDLELDNFSGTYNNITFLAIQNHQGDNEFSYMISRNIFKNK